MERNTIAGSQLEMANREMHNARDFFTAFFLFVIFISKEVKKNLRCDSSVSPRYVAFA